MFRISFFTIWCRKMSVPAQPAPYYIYQTTFYRYIRWLHHREIPISRWYDCKIWWHERDIQKNCNRILFLPNSFEHEQENPFEQFYKISLLIILFCLVDKMQYNVSDILLKSMLFSYPKWVSTGDDWDESVWMAFSIICTVLVVGMPYIQTFSA